jgi:hypothetical protein
VANTIPDETRLMISIEIENYGKMFHRISHEAHKRGERTDDTTTMYGMVLMLCAAAIRDRHNVLQFIKMLDPKIFQRLGDMIAGYEAAKRTEKDKTDGTD